MGREAGTQALPCGLEGAQSPHSGAPSCSWGDASSLGAPGTGKGPAHQIGQSAFPHPPPRYLPRLTFPTPPLHSSPLSTSLLPEHFSTHSAFLFLLSENSVGGKKFNL